MTDDFTLRAMRRRVRAGEMPPELVNELRAVARRLARGRRMPPGFAPYGSWDDEAADEVFASWYADRLVGEGRLLALLDRAPDMPALRRLAERSLRQHLLNAHDRTQARNLFARVVSLLAGDPTYRLVRDASRPQHRWYALAAGADAEPWTGSERLLVAHAWALGDFAVIRYRAAAAKLSPVLDAAELERFATGLFRRTASALTPALITQALATRFALGEVEFVAVETADQPISASPGADTEVLLGDTARVLLMDLTPRQIAILKRSGDKVADIGAAIGCSVGTVVNEQRRIGALVTRSSGDDAERDALLNLMADALYGIGDA